MKINLLQMEKVFYKIDFIKDRYLSAFAERWENLVHSAGESGVGFGARQVKEFGQEFSFEP